MNEKTCPVCGYEMAEGPRNFNICPSCGTEFGLHDVNASIEELRTAWLATGPRWYSRVIAQPENWQPLDQQITVYLNAHAWHLSAFENAVIRIPADLKVGGTWKVGGRHEVMYVSLRHPRKNRARPKSLVRTHLPVVRYEDILQEA